MESWFGYFIAFVMGSVVGSFVNVVIYRLPSIGAAHIRSGATMGLSHLAWPLSYCPHCGMQIKPWNNIPIFSYMFLRGKSACCNKKIAIQYPMVELLGAAIVTMSVHEFGFSSWALYASIFCFFLLATAWIDFQRYVLPDVLVMPMLWIGLFISLSTDWLPVKHSLGGVIIAYLVLASIGKSTVLVMRKRMLGNGDPKFFAAIGAWLGWQALPAVLFIAALLAVAHGLGAKLLAGNRVHFVPFGPGLAIAATIVLFMGSHIIPLYLSR